MTFNARHWDSDLHPLTNPTMGPLEAEVEDLAYKLEAAKNIGICIGSARVDEGEILTGAEQTPQAGAAIPGDLSGLGSMLQVRVSVGLRVSVWGASTGMSATCRCNYFSAAAPAGTRVATITTTTLHNPSLGFTMNQSAWTDAFVEVGQVLDMVARVDVITAEPNTWQWWGSIWIRSRP